MFLLFSSCSTTKFVPSSKYLLTKVKIKSDQEGFDVSSLEPYIRQKANSKWFSVFKIPLYTYELSGKDSTKWVNRELKRIGERPVIYDTLQARLSCQDLVSSMRNMGYMNARVGLKTHIKGKKVNVVYLLHPGPTFTIGRVNYVIDDDSIAHLLRMDQESNRGLHPGMKFTVNALQNERNRVTSLLNNLGFYHFHKEFIQYSADTVPGKKDIALTFHLLKYRANSDSRETFHPRYQIHSVHFLSGDSDRVHLRPRVLDDNTDVKAGHYYSATDLQRTYRNFSRLQAVKFTNIRFNELPDSNLLDCNIQITMNKPSSVSFQPEGTNTAGDLGAAASLTYTNRNLFRGSEQLSVVLRGAYEAITGLEGYKNQDYQEFSIGTKLAFPRFLVPFGSRTFRDRQTASTEFSVNWDFQNRPEFHRRVFSTTWSYHWSNSQHHINYHYDFLNLNYVYMPWISETFKQDYLDNVSTRNSILKYNYEDLFIMRTGFGLSYSNEKDAIRANVETAGNLLQAFSQIFPFKKNSNGQHTLFNIAYAQYAKFDFDYTHLIHFDMRNALALHGDFGIAVPYGNSRILPFEKRYFTGGANSMRGWGVRELGPGKFRGTDGRIDFINQTGDMKLDMNVEYRTFLFWKLYAAAFVDAGNIWTLRNYADQPGGEFQWNSFYKEIAVSYGLGLRFNFNYFILRFDVGMKAINPAYETQNEHYAIFHPDFGRDLAFHFAVGLPF
ncbi:MAG: BamA/TamA family outer membrane protein [Prevotella sp.]|nr:BamA/TamA family outer membrane protein [Prevotella sp.]MCH4241828.1 BamA/TamA family outer membrane protein [Prevotella sp.]